MKLCIGKHATGHEQLKESLGAHFNQIFPAMLRLATDVDGFARKLFEPLTKQVELARDLARGLVG